MNKYSLTDMPNEVKNPTLKCTRARNPSSYAGYGFTGNTVMESNETDCTNRVRWKAAVEAHCTKTKLMKGDSTNLLRLFYFDEYS